MRIRSWTRFLNWFRALLRATYCRITGNRRRTSVPRKKKPQRQKAPAMRQYAAETLEPRQMMTVSPYYDSASHSLLVTSDNANDTAVVIAQDTNNYVTVNGSVAYDTNSQAVSANDVREIVIDTLGSPEVSFDEFDQAAYDSLATLSISGDDTIVWGNLDGHAVATGATSTPPSNIGADASEYTTACIGTFDNAVTPNWTATFSGSLGQLIYDGNKVYVAHPEELTYLDCSNRGLAGSLNLTDCMNLSTLNCSGNQLRSLTLTGTVNLSYLDCSWNALAGELDVTCSTNLGMLNCYGNQLSSLNVPGLSALTYLDCACNQLTSLELTGLDNLNVLSCYNNHLTSLDLSNVGNLYLLDCGTNQLTSLELTGLANLNYFYCAGNQLTSLDLSNVGNLYQLDCGANQLTTVTVDELSTLQWAYAQNNALDAASVDAILNSCDQRPYIWVYVDLSGGVNAAPTANSAAALDQLQNHSSYLNLNSDTTLVRVGECASPTSGYSADFGGNDGAVIFFGNGVYISHPENLVSLNVVGRGLTGSLDLTACPNLRELYCDGNQLTALEVAGLASLNYLACSNNQLSALNLTGVSGLYALDCTGNHLTDLQLADCHYLSTLMCIGNQLTTLDLTGLPELYYLDCSNNRLESIDATSVTKLLYVYGSGNSLDAPSVDGLLNACDQVYHYAGYCDLSGGTNAAPAYASATARSVLLAYGWDILLNRTTYVIPGSTTTTVTGFDGSQWTVTSEPGPDSTLTLGLGDYGEMIVNKSGEGVLNIVSIAGLLGATTFNMVNGDTGSGSVHFLSDTGSPAYYDAWGNVVRAGGLLTISTGSGSVVFDSDQHLDRLFISDSSATITGGHLLATNILSLQSSSYLDIGSGAVIVNYPASDITGWIASGRNSGSNGPWTGAGIRSSAAANDSSQLTAVGIGDNLILEHPTFRGEAVSPNAVLIGYTYAGDVDLSGVIDGIDIGQLGAYLDLPGSWLQGDADYDGSVTSADQQLQTAAMAAQPVLVGQFSAPTSGWSADFGGNPGEVIYDGNNVYITHPENLISLDCSDRGLAGSLDLTACTNLISLMAYNNQLSTVNVAGLSSLSALNVYHNQLTALDMSGLSGLTFLECAANQLVGLDLSNLSALTYLDCAYNRLDSLGVAGLNNLNMIDCSYNQLESLDVSGLGLLQYLYCIDNQLTILNTADAPSLQFILCQNNHLTSLSVTELSDFYYLDCSNNQLTELNVSGGNNWHYLDCSHNALTSLDVSDLTNLSDLRCAGNSLSSITPGGLALLYHVDASGNSLDTASIDGLLNASGTIYEYPGSVDLSGGRNAPPSDDSIGIVTALRNAGWSVQFNGDAITIPNAVSTSINGPDGSVWNVTGVSGENNLKFYLDADGLLIVDKTGDGTLNIESVSGLNRPSYFSMAGNAGSVHFLSDTGAPAYYDNDNVFHAAVGYLTINTGGGGVVFESDQHLNQLVLSDCGATIVGGRQLTVGNLSIAPWAYLDIGRGAVVVNYAEGQSQIGSITNWIASGRNNGTWTGLGINSSAAANDASQLTAIGVADNAELGLVNFRGEAVSPNAVLIRYTYAGDVDLSGVIDGIDLGQLTANLNSPGSWLQGDADYDGSVTSADQQLQAAAMAAQPVLVGQFSAPTSGWSADFGGNEGEVIYFGNCVYISHPENLVSLNLVGYGLTGSLDLTACTNLRELYCDNNQLTGFDVAGLANLNYLSCSNDQLSSLNLTGVTGLFALDCGGNQLTELQLADCRCLSTLMCGDNQLTTLDLSGLSVLAYLACQDSQLTHITMDGHQNLLYLYAYNNALDVVSVDSLLNACNQQPGNWGYIDLTGASNAAPTVNSYNSLRNLITNGLGVSLNWPTFEIPAGTSATITGLDGSQWNVTSADVQDNSLTFTLDGSGHLVATKSGDGTLSIESVSCLAGPTDFNMAGGTARFLSDTGGNLTISTSSGSVYFDSDQHLDSLILSDNSAHIVGNHLLSVNNLQIWSWATLDIDRGAVIVNYPDGQSPLNDITNWIASGRNNGSYFGNSDLWTGPGINSSTAAQNSRAAIGILDNNDDNSAVYSTFKGEAVPVNCVLVEYTLAGDANLDQRVDNADVGRLWIGQNIPNAVPNWANGNFNFKGAIDAEDADLLLQNIGHGAPTVAPMDDLEADQFTGRTVLQLANIFNDPTYAISQLTFDVSVEDAALVHATVDPLAGTLTLQFQDDQIGSTHIKVTATNIDGLSASTNSFAIKRIDHSPLLDGTIERSGTARTGISFDGDAVTVDYTYVGSHPTVSFIVTAYKAVASDNLALELVDGPEGATATLIDETHLQITWTADEGSDDGDPKWFVVSAIANGDPELYDLYEYVVLTQGSSNYSPLLNPLVEFPDGDHKGMYADDDTVTVNYWLAGSNPTVSFVVSASDTNAGDHLQFFLDDGPLGAELTQVDNTHARITWTANESRDCNWTYDFKVSVVDDESLPLYDEHVYHVDLTGTTDHQPRIDKTAYRRDDTPADVMIMREAMYVDFGKPSIGEEYVVKFDVVAHDDNPNATFTFQLINPPAGASIAQDPNNANRACVTWTGGACTGTATTVFQVQVTNDAADPKSVERKFYVATTHSNPPPGCDADGYAGTYSPVSWDDDLSLSPDLFQSGQYVGLGNVLDNDLVPGPVGYSPTLQLIDDARFGHITLRNDGTFDYLPNDPNNMRDDWFTYQAATATVDAQGNVVGSALGNVAVVRLTTQPAVSFSVQPDAALHVAEGASSGTLTFTIHAEHLRPAAAPVQLEYELTRICLNLSAAPADGQTATPTGQTTTRHVITVAPDQTDITVEVAVPTDVLLGFDHYELTLLANSNLRNAELAKGHTTASGNVVHIAVDDPHNNAPGSIVETIYTLDKPILVVFRTANLTEVESTRRNQVFTNAGLGTDFDNFSAAAVQQLRDQGHVQVTYYGNFRNLKPIYVVELQRSDGGTDIATLERVDPYWPWDEPTHYKLTGYYANQSLDHIVQCLRQIDRERWATEMGILNIQVKTQMILTTLVTGWGALLEGSTALGVTLTLDGVDQFSTAVHEGVTGQEQATYKAQAISWTLTQAGVDPEMAKKLAPYIDAALPLIAGGFDSYREYRNSPSSGPFGPAQRFSAAELAEVDDLIDRWQRGTNTTPPPAPPPVSPPRQVATTWPQHETFVTQELQAANPGQNIGTQVTLDVTNLTTGEVETIRIDNLVPQGNVGQPTYQLVDAKFSSVRDLTNPNLNLASTVTDSQAIAYQWIARGQPVRVVPRGQNAINAGLRVGQPINVNPSIEIHVNGRNGIVVRQF